ncbi:MAG: hypothetical protein COX62_02760 [Deltaproteobacteria bacterium CG_4_10_14_0_2_um_filter_43_8]|nr:MAG: hypothetical protein COV43_05020 [Deltaproteobacteria bacterium CG11_big_fil_rev_8_21_14_0_20_42_23]PJA21313.1 MAG: hypothetical protein COX62_02760 [Deltaproteobacteria bacterium CG_4_10_14_0_2_um_filter_43_8]PJC63592.1 MAG: hypothetical protein CO021_08500 [Deltaproteobacteria bacterium CG_4_9_14_0_2_um_filter_42_21]
MQNRRERPKDEAGWGPETGAYREIREDFGVPQRRHWVAQQVMQEVYCFRLDIPVEPALLKGKGALL